MPAARAAAGLSRVIGAPSSRTRPVSGPCTPARILTRVDLPAPFSPTSAWASPPRSSSRASRRAATAPKNLLTSSSARTTGPGAGGAWGWSMGTTSGVCETFHHSCGADHKQPDCNVSTITFWSTAGGPTRRLCVDTFQNCDHHQVRASLRHRARTTEEGSVTASIRDVAERAGVSLGTVSNVLNRPDVVSEGTRQRVLAAIAELGFVRNESARQLRAGHSRTIGLVVLDIANPFFTDVARGVEEVANAAGLAVILCNSDDLAEKEAAHLDVLAEQRVQGVLITPTAELSPALDALRARGVPVVLLDRRATEPDRCAVAVDDLHGGRLAADHLLERGHRRIAFVGGSSGLPQVQERHDGVEQAVLEACGSDDALTVFSPEKLTVAAGREAAERIIGMPAARRPTAAICANDLLALGMLQEMVRHGMHVPEDFAIVGYDDIDFAAAAAVPLSSVRKPRQELGRRAAQLLIDEARGENHLHEQLLFEPTLVVRESSMVRRTVAPPSARTA